MVDAKVDGCVQQLHRIGLLHRLSVKSGHPHAAKPDGVHGRAVFPNLATDHGNLLLNSM
jgi:hypothetical protein